MQHSQAYTEAVSNYLELGNHNPMSNAEANFAIFASRAIRDPRAAAFEIIKARLGSRSIHPALEFALWQESQGTDEPMPFVI